MQHLLPVAIQGILLVKVQVAITRLCFVFNAICSKVIYPATLDELDLFGLVYVNYPFVVFSPRVMLLRVYIMSSSTCCMLVSSFVTGS